MIITINYQVYNSTVGELADLTDQWKESITNKWNNGLEKIVEITRKGEIKSSKGEASIIAEKTLLNLPPSNGNLTQNNRSIIHDIANFENGTKAT